MQKSSASAAVRPGGVAASQPPPPPADANFVHSMRLAQGMPTPGWGPTNDSPARTALPMKNPFENWREELSNRATYRATMAELVGTTTFLLFGLGSQLVCEHFSLGYPAAKIATVAFGWAFAFFFAAFLFGHHSIGLFNPAFALGLMCVGRLSAVRFGMYIVAEVVGALLAAGLLFAIMPVSLRSGGAQALVQPGSSWGIAFATEIVLTCFLGMALSALLIDRKQKLRPALAAVLGAGLFICTLVGYAISGPALNPVRSLASGVIGNVWGRYHWINWIGPMIGAPLGVALHTGLFTELLKDKVAPFDTLEYQPV